MIKVIKRLSNFLYGKEPFELVFDAPVKDAARRLSAHVHKTPFTGLMSERMEGNVSVITGINLQRVIPFAQNPSQPIMLGTFTQEEGKTKLTGIFRLHLLVQIFMTLWLGIVALFSFESLIEAITIPSPTSISLWIGPLMFCFVIGIIKIGKWFARNDKEWLIEKVTSAIENA
jgi:hypothetical protein